MQRFFSLIDLNRQIAVIGDLDHAGTLSNDYVLLVVLSCVIATFGLVLDSAAVIIGAMLVAPLMSPILRCALAFVSGDLRRIGQALATLLVGVVLAVGLSALLGVMVSTSAFNFLEDLPQEVLSRTRPNLFDLVVALAGGTAAAYALAQPHLSAALPGVAIATALMPPLCAVGIGVSQGRLDVSGGALLLFLSNFIAIVFAGSLVFIVVGFRPSVHSLRQAVVSRALLVEGLLIVLVSSVLFWLMVGIVRDARENQTIRTTLVSELGGSEDTALVSFERDGQSDHLSVIATIRSPRALTFAEATELQRALAVALQRTVALKLLVIPVTRLDPLEPPTFTPTPPPGATATPTSTRTVQPTVTPTSTPTPSQTPTPTATATPLPPTSPPPTPTLTPPASPTSTLTPVAYAVIGGTDRRGANVRRFAGRTPVITALSDGTLVQLLGQRVTADGIIWVEVRLADGREGWVAGDYLVPYGTYAAP